MLLLNSARMRILEDPHPRSFTREYRILRLFSLSAKRPNNRLLPSMSDGQREFVLAHGRTDILPNRDEPRVFEN
jgi:hypothetical protein